VRLSLMLSLAAVAVVAAFALSRAALARQTVRPAEPASLRALRSLTDHYRALTWTYELAVRDRRTPTSFSYRRAVSRSYLRYTVELWARRADRAHRAAIVRLERRLGVDLPAAAPLRAPLRRRIVAERLLAVRLRRIYPGRVARAYLRAAGGPQLLLRTWQSRAALAALAVARHGRPAVPAPLLRAFSCIHAYEGAWTANTGNGYYGGLQMDASFERRYGPDFVRRWGTADNWPVWAQLQAAVRAYRAGRGFGPWPTTARLCGLI